MNRTRASVGTSVVVVALAVAGLAGCGTEPVNARPPAVQQGSNPMEHQAAKELAEIRKQQQWKLNPNEHLGHQAEAVLNPNEHLGHRDAVGERPRQDRSLQVG